MFKKTAEKFVKSVKDETINNPKFHKAVLIAGLIATHTVCLLLGVTFAKRNTVTNIYIRR